MKHANNQEIRSQTEETHGMKRDNYQPIGKKHAD